MSLVQTAAGQVEQASSLVPGERKWLPHHETNLHASQTFLALQVQGGATVNQVPTLPCHLWRFPPTFIVLNSRQERCQPHDFFLYIYQKLENIFKSPRYSMRPRGPSSTSFTCSLVVCLEYLQGVLSASLPVKPVSGWHMELSLERRWVRPWTRFLKPQERGAADSPAAAS